MIAKRLNKGEKIGLIAPSTTVSKDLKEKFECGVSYLKVLGFEVVPGKYFFSHTRRFTASPEEKAEDIKSFFSDPAIKMIMAAQGNATANACLEFIDWKVIKKNPKILIGLGDITVLLNAVYTKTGLVTYHGNDLLWGFGNKPTAYDANEFMNKMVVGKSNSIKQKYKWKTIRPGKASGRLIGGNLSAFMMLAGTSYFPDVNGTLLFFEASGATPDLCHSLFYQLKHMGVFHKTNGVIIGYNSGLEEKAYLEQPEITLLQVTKNYDFPILKIMEFGTHTSNTVIPVGLRASMNTQTGEIIFRGSMVG